VSRPDPATSPTAYSRPVIKAYQAMKELSPDERKSVMAWFCDRCLRYVGPGDSCHCWRDE